MPGDALTVGASESGEVLASGHRGLVSFVRGIFGAPRARRGLRMCFLATLACAGLWSYASLTLLGTNTWVAETSHGRWFYDASEITPREFAIVPGIRFYDGQPVSGLKQRLDLAMDLFHRGRVNQILVSGNEVQAGNEATGMRDWLVARGIPASRIVVDPLGNRTLATMTRASHIFGIHSAIVCTQSLHAPRTLFLAQGSGIDAVAYVPRQTRISPLSPSNTHEKWKTSLAFFERYVLRLTNTGTPNDATTRLSQLVIKSFY